MSDEVADVVSSEEPVTTTTTTEQVSAPQQEAPAAPQTSVWDSFKSLPDFEGKDESEIARSLYQVMERERAASRKLQQYQQLIPYAQEYLQNREPFENWRRSQSAPQQPAPQDPAAPQEQEPEFSWPVQSLEPRYRRYLVRDAEGREVISENAPLEARHKIQEYMERRAEFADQFLNNPQEALGPMVEKIAMQKAQELMEQELSTRDEQSFVSNLEKENSDWLYDQSGNPTTEGLAVQRYIQQAKELGIQGAQARWDYATALVERDLLDQIRERNASQQRYQTFAQNLPTSEAAPQEQPAVDPDPVPVVQNSAEKDIEFLRREASRNPSRAAGGGAGGSKSTGAPMTFEERLKAQLQRDNLL
jgi:hypothetical protein